MEKIEKDGDNKMKQIIKIIIPTCTTCFPTLEMKASHAITFKLADNTM